MSAADTTQLILDARVGRPGAEGRLFEHLYGVLRQIARARLRAHHAGTALGTTGLVNEAYLRLADTRRVTPNDRTHFLALAARAMRFVLLDHARMRASAKRGGGRPGLHVRLTALQLVAEERADELLALNLALDGLRAQSERLAEVVELRFFGGLAYDEVAEVTGRSVATVERDWARARAWLYCALQGDSSSEAEEPRAL
ncbi:MAG: ECF-type sigma factor [Rubricoccaceae bacterium]|nr:ECF-type sigma factor [Rubricoccaceae bacterium]